MQEDAKTQPMNSSPLKYSQELIFNSLPNKRLQQKKLKNPKKLDTTKKFSRNKKAKKR